MSEQDTLPVLINGDRDPDVLAQLTQQSPKDQLKLIEQLKDTPQGLDILKDFLTNHSSKPINLGIAKAYQTLWQQNLPSLEEFLVNLFPDGLIPLTSERQIDYHLLANLLLRGDFQAADTLTREKLCELAGTSAIKRKWIYFTEVEQFPAADLRTINQLWWLFSEGKFGFEVQRKLWLGVNQDFVKLWVKIGWKNGNSWTKFPQEFIWDLSAPAGHLPLSNQLRGVRLIAAIFAHPVWNELDNSQ